MKQQDKKAVKEAKKLLAPSVHLNPNPNDWPVLLVPLDQIKAKAEALGFPWRNADACWQAIQFPDCGLTPLEAAFIETYVNDAKEKGEVVDLEKCAQQAKDFALLCDDN